MSGISIVHAVFKRRANVIKGVSTGPEFLCRKSTGFLLLQIVPRTGQLRVGCAYAAPWRLTGAHPVGITFGNKQFSGTETNGGPGIHDCLVMQLAE